MIPMVVYEQPTTTKKFPKNCRIAFNLSHTHVVSVREEMIRIIFFCPM
jgi:hypothetical protein